MGPSPFLHFETALKPPDSFHPRHTSPLFCPLLSSRLDGGEERLKVKVGVPHLAPAGAPDFHPWMGPTQ